MAYTKTVWQNGGPPAISAEMLNKIEQGIKDAHVLAELAIASGNYTYGTTTLTGSFPAMAGSSPNYTYTVVTFNIPVGSTANEVEVFANHGSFKVIRGLNFVIATNWNDSDGSLYSRVLNPSNKGYGSTITVSDGHDSVLVFSTGSLFGVKYYIILIDAYLSGSNLVLKFTNTSTSDRNNVSQKFDYIIKG